MSVALKSTNFTKHYTNTVLSKKIFRGDIFIVDFSNAIGSEYAGIRPAVVLQNNIGNRYSPTIIVAPITSKTHKAKLPTHVELKSEESGLQLDSVAMLEQIRVIDKSRLKDKVTSLNSQLMDRIDAAMLVSLGK